VLVEYVLANVIRSLGGKAAKEINWNWRITTATSELSSASIAKVLRSPCCKHQTLAITLLGIHTFAKNIFHTFSIPNLKTLIRSFSFIFRNFTHGTQYKKICKTVISDKEHNLKKQMAEFGISILFQYFTYILAKFHTFSILSMLRGKPDTGCSLVYQERHEFTFYSQVCCHRCK